MENNQLRPLSEFNTELKQKGFTVFQIESDGHATRVYSRKDFYKICLTTGKSIIHYADRSFETDGTVLFFGNPHIPYSWETISTSYVGYTVLFAEDFLKPGDRSESLQQSPLFKLALLQHTNWTIAEIAYALGFEYPTYFNNFFKRLTGAVPSSFRAEVV